MEVWYIGVEDEKGNPLGELKTARRISGKRVIVWKRDDKEYYEVYKKPDHLISVMNNRDCPRSQILDAISFINEVFRSKEEHMDKGKPS